MGQRLHGRREGWLARGHHPLDARTQNRDVHAGRRRGDGSPARWMESSSRFIPFRSWRWGWPSRTASTSRISRRPVRRNSAGSSWSSRVRYVCRAAPARRSTQSRSSDDPCIHDQDRRVEMHFIEPESSNRFRAAASAAADDRRPVSDRDRGGRRNRRCLRQGAPGHRRARPLCRDGAALRGRGLPARDSGAGREGDGGRDPRGNRRVRGATLRPLRSCFRRWRRARSSRATTRSAANPRRGRTSERGRRGSGRLRR